jgi:hypothetical protein
MSGVGGGKGEPLGTTTLRLGGGAPGTITPALWARADVSASFETAADGAVALWADADEVLGLADGVLGSWADADGAVGLWTDADGVVGLSASTGGHDPALIRARRPR